jgi:hypothetical protein
MLSCDFTLWRNPQLEVVDVDAVELSKPNKFHYVPHNLQSGLCREQFVLRLGRAVAVGANVVTHKLELFSEDETIRLRDNLYLGRLAGGIP